jgi:hypothetical protein
MLFHASMMPCSASKRNQSCQSPLTA